MKESDKNKDITPGLEEALHPEIGNGAWWTNDEHDFSLSVVDPLKSLDGKLVEDMTSAKIINQWSNPPGMEMQSGYRQQDTDELPTSDNHQIKGTSESLEPKPQDQVSNEVIPPPYSENLTPSPVIPVEAQNKKGRKGKEKPALKVGKRIRKVAEKVRLEEENRKPKKEDIPAPILETNLSPFTSWLKGLSGSEYVHPYDDDFAFNQAANQAGEGISETFADLLAAQGYKDQAIAMYTRLIEKFPEKSRFFAAKIEALQP